MRNAGRLKLGYYPLPIQEARNLRNLLIAPQPFFAVDPCAGDGTTLLGLMQDLPAQSAAIELDADRAAASGSARNADDTRQHLRFTPAGGRLAVVGTSILLTTWRWDGTATSDWKLVFLDHCYGWLKTDGILIFVIPDIAFTHCAKRLASQFERISVFRLGHPESLRFHQLAVIGIRKPEHKRGYMRAVDQLLRLAYQSARLPILGQTAERYTVPSSVPVAVQYRGLPLDEIEDALVRSSAMQSARNLLIRQPESITGRPVTPLHGGHVGLLCTAGMLNGVFGQGPERHIAYWRSVKHVDVYHEEEDGYQIVSRRERFSHELTLAYQTGRVVVLKETEHEVKRTMKMAHERFGELVYIRRPRERGHTSAFI